MRTRRDELAITATMVKELRERTGLGMMDCKKALVDAGGDMELAIEELRKKSVLKAAKKSGRTTANGLLGLKVADDATKAAIVEINIETDFAAKNEKFIAFVSRVANVLFDSQEGDLESLMQSGLDKERETLVQEIGENISIRRGELVLAPAGGCVASYLHTDNLKGSLVVMKTPASEIGRDIAMHITAINPMVVRSEQIPKETVEKERQIYVSQAEESGKPADIVEKMVEGRVKKFLSEVSLVDQPFVKDPDKKVGDLVKAAGSEVISFYRLEVGEGIEIKEEDFAAEVAAQLKESQ